MRIGFLYFSLALVLISGHGYGATSKSELHEYLPNNSKAASVISRKSIDVAASGQVQAEFQTVVRLFLRDDMIELVQRQYAAMLSEDESPSFNFEQTSPGAYSYTNRDQEISEIIECFKIVDKKGDFQLLYLVHGKRFFGEFDALIHIAAKPAEAPGSTDFSVRIYACPLNRVSRGIITRLPIVPSYFRRRTREMVEVGTRISAELCRQAGEGKLNAATRSSHSAKQL